MYHEHYYIYEINVSHRLLRTCKPRVCAYMLAYVLCCTYVTVWSFLLKGGRKKAHESTRIRSTSFRQSLYTTLSTSSVLLNFLTDDQRRPPHWGAFLSKCTRTTHAWLPLDQRCAKFGRRSTKKRSTNNAFMSRNSHITLYSAGTSTFGAFNKYASNCT